jgi:cell division protein ZapB
MDNSPSPAAARDAQPLKSLERKIAELIHLCEQLDRENRFLKNEAHGWQREREQLIQKTEMARTKVEAMIARLRTLEQES